MKNIHILPTNKPSRLYLGNNGNFVFGKSQTAIQSINADFTNKNICIINDEEIKEGDWYINTFVNEREQKPQNHTEKRHLINHQKDYRFKYCKKIILTTDQNLIADGLQSIDDEFLDWFVKNPSCERVEIVKDKKLSSKSIYDAVEGDLVYSHHGYGGVINSLSKDIRVGIDNYIETAITSETGWETLDINNYKIYDKYYKIIIPKEEPKQEITLEEIEQQIALTELRGMRVVKYLDKYKGQNIYNEIALAIEFGYQLKLEENE